MGASSLVSEDRAFAASPSSPSVSPVPASIPLRGATTFLVACFRKTRAELSSTLAEPAKLEAAAAYHNIPAAWARFWMNEEANRSDRRN